MPTPRTKDWKAIDNKRPPNSTLTVTGLVETPNASSLPVLKRAVPQGINPAILMLNLTIEAIGEPGAEVVDFRPAEYEEDSREKNYEQVDIHWDNECVAQVRVVRLD